MNLHTLIMQLGYSSHEAAVYLAALARGGATETDIAAHASLPRTTVSAVVAALQKKGLMKAYLKGRYHVWTAEGPEKLLAILAARESSLRAALPEFRSLHHDEASVPRMPRAYAGISGIRQIMGDILTTQHHIRAVLPWGEWEELLGPRFLRRFIALRKKRFLHIQLLVPQTPASSALKARDREDMRITQFLPDGLAITSGHFIYGDKVAIILLGEHPLGITLEGPDMAATFGLCFESLWVRSGGAREDFS